MKKSIIIFLISLLILNIFVISLIKAQDSDSALPPELQGIQKAGEKLTDEEQRSQYLKQEWGKILANNTFFGPIIKGYEKIAPVVNPVSKYTLGIKPSLSWLFILTLTLWICILIYLIRIFELFPILSGFTRIVICLGVMMIISSLEITKKLAEKIINIISLFTTWWMQLIGIGLVIIGLIVASIFSKNFKEVGKAMKEKRKRRKR